MWLLSSLIAILFLLETESCLIAVCGGRRKGGERKRREGGREGGRREGGERKRREENETRHKAVHNLKANTYTDREEQLDDKTCSGRLATLKSWKLLICTKRRP